MSTLAHEPQVAPAKAAGTLPSGPVDPGGLNLSRRPFVNSRPVVRAAIALWLLGSLLLLGNVSLFWEYLGSSEDKRAELAKIEAAVEKERQTGRQLEDRLAGFDLQQQNERVGFLNQQIAERTFSWSLLFDRLAAVLPDDVRLVRLNPSAGDPRQARTTSRERRSTDKVVLGITGESRSDEALDQFVDNLFAHPAFGDPNPTRTGHDEESNLVNFDLTVEYRPGGAPKQAVPAGAEGPAPVVVEEEAPSLPLLPQSPQAPETVQ